MSTIWPVLHYDDTARARRFLVEAFGLEEALAVCDEQGEPVHVELRWPGGGALVFGSTKHRGGVHDGLHAGAVYLSCGDVDAVHARASAAGAEIVEAPHETAFGSGEPTRAFSARDPEGNLWTFGTYRGAPWPATA